jgi:hypothetical protein
VIPGSTPPLGQLWQVPTFLLGLVALVAVCAARPLWHDPVPAGADPALAALRELLQQPEFDGDRALKLGADALHEAHTPSDAAEAHFLLASTYEILAERAGAGQASEQWRQARGHLEQATALGLASQDQPRLNYLMAKAWAHTGESPPKVIATLAAAIEHGSANDADAARGYGLLAEAYLKLSTPDLEKALAATVKEIDLPTVDPVLLAPARLRRGELLLRLERAEEGRKVLQELDGKAPAEIVLRARRLRVASLEQEGHWPQAAELWREIRDDAKTPSPDRALVLYHLGLSLRKSERREDALNAWEECLAEATGDEGPAAALGLAELPRGKGGAVAGFERAVQGIKEPGDWNNGLVTLTQARQAFENGCQAARAAGAFEASVRVAVLYERLGIAGRAQELRAEALDGWARATQDRAREPNAHVAQLLGEAEALLRQAGEAHEQAAAARTDLDERAERLWSAANDYFDGHDMVHAAAAFERFVKIAWPEQSAPQKRFLTRLNEAYYKLALARRDAGLGSVREALERAVNRLEYDSRYVYRARYELALLERKPDGSWTDQSQAFLEQNLILLRSSTDRDAEAREKTLYALGDLYFDRHKERGVISKTIDTLEEALRDYPGNANAVWARRELAESYHFRADQLSASLSQERPTLETRLVIERKVMEDREKAIAHYQALARELETRPARSPDEEHLLAHALWQAADVRYWAGGYEKSAEMFDLLAERFKGRKGLEIDYVDALANVVRGYSHAIMTYPASDPDHDARLQVARQKALRALRELRAVLPTLPPEVRQPVEDWLKKNEAAAPR